MRKKLNFVFKEAGFSLIEITVGMGVLSLLGLGAAYMSKNM